MRVAFVYAPGRLDRLAGARAGIVPTEFFFGALELERRGHEVGYFEAADAPAPDAVHRVLSWLYRRELLPSWARPGLIRQVGALRAALRRYQVVVGTTTGIALALALWRELGAFRAPVVGILLGLADDPAPRWPRRRLNGYLLRRMWSQLFGEGEMAPLLARYPQAAARVIVNQFGVDTAFWTPGDGAEGDAVLSLGKDSRRDWGLLVEAAGKLDCPVRILTGREIAGPLPPNVTRLDGTWKEAALRELYRRARCVVIPLRESFRPAGQSVCLQAMACGRPVVLTRTRGLWSSATVRDGENVLLVPPGDASALVTAVETLLADPGRRRGLGACARETVCRDARIQQFAERLERLCRAALAGGR